jgi:hypothetical protein
MRQSVRQRSISIGPLWSFKCGEGLHRNGMLATFVNSDRQTSPVKRMGETTWTVLEEGRKKDQGLYRLAG